MATYAELYDLRSNSDLRNKVLVACAVAAELIRLEAGATPNHANRLLWAKQVFANPDPVAATMLQAVLAQNRTLTSAQIVGASDAAIQTAVNNAVDVLATGA